MNFVEELHSRTPILEASITFEKLCRTHVLVFDDVSDIYRSVMFILLEELVLDSQISYSDFTPGFQGKFKIRSVYFRMLVRESFLAILKNQFGIRLRQEAMDFCWREHSFFPTTDSGDEDGNTAKVLWFFSNGTMKVNLLIVKVQVQHLEFAKTWVCFCEARNFLLMGQKRCQCWCVIMSA